MALLTPAGLVLLFASAVCPQAIAGEAECQDIASRYIQGKGSIGDWAANTFLFEAAEAGCKALVEQLLASGGSVSLRGRLGETALHHAARGGEEEVVSLLIDRGAAINRRDLSGSTPLFYAAEAGRAKAAKLLLDQGADPNIEGRAAVTPLEAAVFNGNERLAGMLLKRGADPRHVDRSGKAAIVYAAARGFSSLIDHLLAAGVDVNARYGNDLTALMWAAGYSNDVPEAEGLATVVLLLDKGARIDDSDDRGRTALMIASEAGHTGVVDLLLKRGADPKLKDKSGKNAADLAATEAIKTALRR